MIPENNSKLQENYNRAIILLKEIMADVTGDHPRYDEILKIDREIREGKNEND